MQNMDKLYHCRQQCTPPVRRGQKMASWLLYTKNHRLYWSPNTVWWCHWSSPGLQKKSAVTNVWKTSPCTYRSRPFVEASVCMHESWGILIVFDFGLCTDVVCCSNVEFLAVRFEALQLIITSSNHHLFSALQDVWVVRGISHSCILAVGKKHEKQNAANEFTRCGLLLCMHCLHV
jgi:hypothetical protein